MKAEQKIDGASAIELHDLYGKHQYIVISEGNAISYCSCGDWVTRTDRVRNLTARVNTRLLPCDFNDAGPFSLLNVMHLLRPEQKVSLAKHLKRHGYGSLDAGRRVELEKYLNKEAVV